MPLVYNTYVGGRIVEKQSRELGYGLVLDAHLAQHRHIFAGQLSIRARMQYLSLVNLG